MTVPEVIRSPYFGSGERADAELVPLWIGHCSSSAKTRPTYVASSRCHDLADRFVNIEDGEA